VDGPWADPHITKLVIKPTDTPAPGATP